jgi:glycolate oxidase FAD binding subunit
MNSDADFVGRLRERIGADLVANGDVTDGFIVDGLRPQCVLFPSTVDQLSRCMTAADEAGLAFIPTGNGTQLGIGRVPQRYDVALSTRHLRRIVAHEAADMTVTVEAGLRLAELNAALAAAGQRLPLDPPHPEQVTVGALIATDASGPLRLSQGKVRDLLIGITVVLADGTIVKGGGRVVKNVAGYDLMKLFTGSFGTLGVIAEATFKIRPCPERAAIFVVPAARIEQAADLALAVLAAPLAPAFVEVFNRIAIQGMGGDGPAVAIGCEGSAEEINAQRERLEVLAGQIPVRVVNDAEGTRLGTELRDFQSADACGCKVSLLPSKLAALLRHIEDEAGRCGCEAALLAHVGNGAVVVRFGGPAITNGAFVSFAERLRATVRAGGGWVVFDALPVALKGQIDPWGADAPGLTLMRGIKQTLDPKGRLSPGRFVGGI